MRPPTLVILIPAVSVFAAPATNNIAAADGGGDGHGVGNCRGFGGDPFNPNGITGGGYGGGYGGGGGGYESGHRNKREAEAEALAGGGLGSGGGGPHAPTCPVAYPMLNPSTPPYPYSVTIDANNPLDVGFMMPAAAGGLPDADGPPGAGWPGGAWPLGAAGQAGRGEAGGGAAQTARARVTGSTAHGTAHSRGVGKSVGTNPGPCTLMLDMTSPMMQARGCARVNVYALDGPAAGSLVGTARVTQGAVQTINSFACRPEMCFRLTVADDDGNAGAVGPGGTGTVGPYAAVADGAGVTETGAAGHSAVDGHAGYTSQRVQFIQGNVAGMGLVMKYGC